MLEFATLTKKNEKMKKRLKTNKQKKTTAELRLGLRARPSKKTADVSSQ